MDKIAKFFFEAGMLKKTPRTGYQFLGSGQETVAEHSFRTTVIGYVLALQEPEADVKKTVLMCLFHDIHEARTGDLNYVNKKYVKSDEHRAVKDLAKGLPFGEDLISLSTEFNACDTIEALITQDADQLDLIVELKEQLDLGNRYAEEWIKCSVKRLKTENGRKMAQKIMETDSSDWWFDKSTDWVNGPSYNEENA